MAQSIALSSIFWGNLCPLYYSGGSLGCWKSFGINGNWLLLNRSDLLWKSIAWYYGKNSCHNCRLILNWVLEGSICICSCLHHHDHHISCAFTGPISIMATVCVLQMWGELQACLPEVHDRIWWGGCVEHFALLFHRADESWGQYKLT